jgi:hypothetical protein
VKPFTPDTAPGALESRRLSRQQPRPLPAKLPGRHCRGAMAEYLKSLPPVQGPTPPKKEMKDDHKS